MADEPMPDYTLAHPIWTDEEIHGVEITHRPPTTTRDRLAYWTVWALRTGFDIASGYSWLKLNEDRCLTRIIFLETVAGVPGMMGAMARHLNSLRTMKRDHGWIHTLLEEAENERMHLLTAMELKQASWLTRMGVIAAQGICVNLLFLAYLISPAYVHRLVGYLEEEAVKTYTHIIQELDKGNLPQWSAQAAPKIAIKYWKLDQNAMMRDVLLAIRSDEAHHRNVNHHFGDLKKGDTNPFGPGF